MEKRFTLDFIEIGLETSQILFWTDDFVVLNKKTGTYYQIIWNFDFFLRNLSIQDPSSKQSFGIVLLFEIISLQSPGFHTVPIHHRYEERDS